LDKAGLEAVAKRLAEGACDAGEVDRLNGSEQACLDLLAHLAQPSIFQKLRTAEQLG
jgi:secreted Zn-dependent insulinase-like peptidase